MALSSAQTDASFESWKRGVTTAAIGVALVLLVIKGLAWTLTGSVAVLATLVDSGLDLLSSFAAFLAVRMAAQPPDDNHRFGHEKAEAISALLQTAVIAASAMLVTIESGRRLLNPIPIDRPGFAIVVLALSLILTMGLVVAQSWAIHRTGSVVLKADRAHYTGDLIANLGILVAIIITSTTDFLRADALAGLVAAGFLFWSVHEVVLEALPELMDEELPDEERSVIEHIIRRDPAVRGFHNLRTRKAGTSRFIQVDLELPGEMLLSDAHEIATRVSYDLRAAFPGADVVVHQDTADDR